jgi:hypothetical protein
MGFAGLPEGTANLPTQRRIDDFQRSRKHFPLAELLLNYPENVQAAGNLGEPSQVVRRAIPSTLDTACVMRF